MIQMTQMMSDRFHDFRPLWKSENPVIAWDVQPQRMK